MLSRSWHSSKSKSASGWRLSIRRLALVRSFASKAKKKTGLFLFSVWIFAGWRARFFIIQLLMWLIPRLCEAIITSVILQVWQQNVQ
jgi:hypothetical protein